MSKTKTTHENQTQRPGEEVRSSTTFVLDKNLGLPISSEAMERGSVRSAISKAQIAHICNLCF